MDRRRDLGGEPGRYHGDAQGKRQVGGEGEEARKGRSGPAGIVVPPPEGGSAPPTLPGLEFGREGLPRRLIPCAERMATIRSP